MHDNTVGAGSAPPGSGISSVGWENCSHGIRQCTRIRHATNEGLLENCRMGTPPIFDGPQFSAMLIVLWLNLIKHYTQPRRVRLYTTIFNFFCFHNSLKKISILQFRGTMQCINAVEIPSSPILNACHTLQQTSWKKAQIFKSLCVHWNVYFYFIHCNDCICWRVSGIRISVSHFLLHITFVYMYVYMCNVERI